MANVKVFEVDFDQFMTARQYQIVWSGWSNDLPVEEVAKAAQVPVEVARLWYAKCDWEFFKEYDRWPSEA